MRWALFRLFPAAGVVANGESIAQRLHLALEPRDLIREFEHRLVLLDHMPFEVGDLFLETSNPDIFTRR